MADAEVNARIVYWGIEGAGTTANLRTIHAKLRPDHRGPLEEIPTRLDPSICYERLMIELGQIAGKRTRIEISTVPATADQAMTRKQLLDRVDGVVLVLDSRAECIDANLETFEEMRRSLAAYGRALDGLPLVVQYNKRDLADPFVLEELHRKLELPHAAVFEAVATEGAGVLQTLTTISKRVVRALRDPARPKMPPPKGAPFESPSPAVTPEDSEGAGKPVPDPRSGSGAETTDEALERLGTGPGGDSAADGVFPQAAPALDPPGEPVLEIDPPTDVPEAELGLSESDQVAARAQSMLDASWDEISRSEEIADDSEGWCISGVGDADVTGPRSVSLPVQIVDEGGRELRFRLNLSLESLDEDTDTGLLR